MGLGLVEGFHADLRNPLCGSKGFGVAAGLAADKERHLAQLLFGSGVPDDVGAVAGGRSGSLSRPAGMQARVGAWAGIAVGFAILRGNGTEMLL